MEEKVEEKVEGGAMTACTSGRGGETRMDERRRQTDAGRPGTDGQAGESHRS